MDKTAEKRSTVETKLFCTADSPAFHFHFWPAFNFILSLICNMTITMLTWQSFVWESTKGFLFKEWEYISVTKCQLLFSLSFKSLKASTFSPCATCLQPTSCSCRVITELTQTTPRHSYHNFLHLFEALFTAASPPSSLALTVLTL